MGVQETIMAVTLVSVGSMLMWLEAVWRKRS